MRLLVQQFGRSTLALLLIFFAALPFSAMAQTKTVKGTVSDSKGTPIAATVTVRGTKNAVATSAEGAFTINASSNAVLVVSAVGYETFEQKVGNGPTVTIILAEKPAALNEVVVVGYGKSSRKTLSSAITTIKPEELNKGSISDVGQLLQGKVPGLNITSSGDPNRTATASATATKYRRCRNSIACAPRPPQAAPPSPRKPGTSTVPWPLPGRLTHLTIALAASRSHP